MKKEARAPFEKQVPPTSGFQPLFWLKPCIGKANKENDALKAAESTKRANYDFDAQLSMDKAVVQALPASECRCINDKWDDNTPQI